MNSIRFTCLGILFLFLALLSGCGDGNSGTSGSRATLKISQLCIDCHAGANDPVVATAKITEEWKISKHNSEIVGAGCIDCHEPQVGHPNVCSRCHGGAPSAFNATGTDVVRNPDAEKKCYKCHGAITLSPGHFTNNTSANAPGSFVSRNYANKCRACHNPHDVTTLLPINRDWAKSGHGNPNGAAWQHYDFKGADRLACMRCHTATGYINFITGAEGATASKMWTTTTDKTKEVLSCIACHETYDFKNSVRKIGAFTAPYNAPNTFPNVGASNLCIACHSGRENMASILAMTNMSGATSPTLKNSHYMAAAGLMYMTTGFTNFTTMTTKAAATNTYGASYTMYYGSGTAPTGNISSTHRKLGTPMINGDSHNPAAFVPGSFDADGPCVTCHMNATGQADRKTSHTFGINANAFNQLCIKCHGAEGTTTLTGDNFETVFIEEQSLVFQNALSLAIKLLKDNYGITYDSATNPYFFNANGKSVTNWKRGRSNAEAKKLMGACYNINLLKREPGAYAHGRTFVRRLIYDTIDYLDDGKINMSTGATALASGMKGLNNAVIYVKGTSANDPATTASYTYLAGYNRTSGAWNTPYERP
ncbi:MAG TPA: hypothetical protein VN642_09315 [Dongiaceae bacterium]|nr:hypothetical protein [Dongiaceae bacterium]